MPRSLGNIIAGVGSRGAANILCLLFAAFALSGCIDLETIVRVKPDGTGTITERVVMSNEIVEMMQEMAAEGQPAELYSEQQLHDSAAKYGDGVTFLHAEDVETDSGKGYIAHYRFGDINLVRIGQNPAEKMPGGPIEGASAADEEKFATFSMEPGNPALLAIDWPVAVDDAASANDRHGSSAPGAAAPTEQQEAAMEMMRMAFRDLRVALHIDVAGHIIETNATHLDGNRVTLMEVDFARLMENDEVMRALAAKKDQSVADVKALMRLVPGVRIEIEPQVHVLFE